MTARRTLHELYSDLRPIRANGAFRVVGAQDRERARRVTLIASDGRETEDGARALSRLAEAHAAIDAPAIPRHLATHVVDGRTVVALDCPAIGDAVTLETHLTRTGTLVPYPCGDGFLRGLRITMQGAHRALDAEGRPRCLGRLSPANVLFDVEGRSHLFGFGHNVAVEDPGGRPLPSVSYTEAPELAIGGQPSPEADYVAVLMMTRLLSRHTDKRGAMGVVIRAVTRRPGDALAEVLRQIERRFIGAMPGQRGSIEEGVAAADRIRDLLGVVPDADGFARIAARVLADGLAELPRVDEDVFLVGPDATFVRFRDEAPVELRGPMRRIVLALSDKHAVGGGTLLRAVDLADIAWPDEQASHEAMMNRVYVTLARLRKRLPEGVVERFDEGYRIAPEVVVHRA
jgi:hypothetical protein